MLRSGDKKQQKEALLATTQKYFPYDYGAAGGAEFQGEPVGEASEDEEYLVYQKNGPDATCITSIWAAKDLTISS